MKKWLQIDYSKYCPSLVITFSHLSDNGWIPYRKNNTFFETSRIDPFFDIFIRMEALLRQAMNPSK